MEGLELREEMLLPAVIMEMSPLLHKHWREVALDVDKIALNPDWPKYIRMNEDGGLRLYVGRIEGRMVAYAPFFVSPNMHYMLHVFALNDVIYVEQSKRGAGIGRELIQFAERELRTLGVSSVYYHTKTAHPQLASLLEDEGYGLVEWTHYKCLI